MCDDDAEPLNTRVTTRMFAELPGLDNVVREAVNKRGRPMGLPLLRHSIFVILYSIFSFITPFA